MTALIDAAVTDALTPVRESLLATARADADRMASAADVHANEVIAAATDQAARILEDARAGGAADAETAFASERARSHRRGRARVLQARRLAYDQLRAQARAAVAGLRQEPEYAGIRETLIAAARRILGPDVEIHDADSGGIIAQLADRRIDLSLAALTDRAVDAVAAGLDQP
jgi:cell division septum initiation protein DivIVA